MSKAVLLALFQNATNQLKDEIMEITEDINYMEHELKITKNKRICDIVKRNYHERKKRKYEELNEFFSQYLKFLLTERKDYFKSSTPKISEGDLYIRKLIENINKTNINSEEQNAKILNDMYQKRNILKDILHLINSNSIQKLSHEDSQNIFDDLISKLKNMNELFEKNCENISNKEEGKSKTDIIKNEKRINNIDKNFFNYLNDDDDDNSSQVYEFSTAPSASSLVYLNSEKTSDIEQTNKSRNIKKEEFTNEVNNTLLKNKEEEKEGHVSFNNKISTEKKKVLEKGSSSYSNHQTKNELFNKSLLNDKLKQNNFGKLLNKFNLTKKSFSNTETKLKVSFLDNKELNKEKMLHIIKEKQISNSYGLKSKIMTNSSNFSGVFMATSKSNNLNNDSKGSIKCFPLSIKGTSDKIHNKEVNEKKYEGERKNCSNSSSSSSSSNVEYKNFRSNSSNSYGRKKYSFRINKNGKGVFSVNGEEKSSKNIYDFEIIFDNSDFDESTRLNNTKDKNKKILQFSFMESGKKICEVKKLYMLNDEQIKNLHFYESYNNSSSKKKYRNSNSKESFHKEEKNMNILEDKIKSLKEENFRRKYELTRIIDDIKYKKLNNNEEGPSYNVEFVETNRLRGLYLQLLERMNELERDRNFYKNELEKMQKDIQNSTLPISEFFKEEKKIFLEREKEFYKKEKNYVKKKNELKKTVFELQSELEITQERLIKEKELNESLNNIINENKKIIEQIKSEKQDIGGANESKIKMLNTECEELREAIVQEKKEKEKLNEEISMHLNNIEKINKELTLLKQDETFNNFRKMVLEKVSKTDGDIKYLAQLLELLTKELENKTIKENLISKQIVEMEQDCLKNKKLLNLSKKKLKNKKNKMDNMNEEISYLIKKNRNLVKTIKHLKLQNSNLSNIEKRGTENFLFMGGKKKKKNEKLIYDKTFNSNIISSDTNGTHFARYLCKNKKDLLKNKQSFTSFSDESSLCNANTKRGYSFEEFMNSINKPKHISKFSKNSPYKIHITHNKN